MLQLLPTGLTSRWRVHLIASRALQLLHAVQLCGGKLYATQALENATGCKQWMVMRRLAAFSANLRLMAWKPSMRFHAISATMSLFREQNHADAGTLHPHHTGPAGRPSFFPYNTDHPHSHHFMFSAAGLWHGSIRSATSHLSADVHADAGALHPHHPSAAGSPRATESGRRRPRLVPPGFSICHSPASQPLHRGPE